MYFNQLGLKQFINNTLDRLHLNELTKIQDQVLPIVLDNKSVIVTSQTGSGKTLCYLLPILNKIDFNSKEIQAVILLPTKELARQVYSKILDFKADESSIKAGLLIGNSNLEEQKASLRRNPPQIIVGTTVRVLELFQQKVINKKISTIAFDEVDMLMDLGFANQISQILGYVDSPELQKIACSATTHESLANKLSKYFKNTKVVSSSNTIWSNQQVTNKVVYMSDNASPIKTLFGLLKNINPYFCIVFCNTRNEASEIYKLMINGGYTNTALLHKDLTTRQRKNIFRDINNNKYQYLVASDLASRGIDIVGADVVISVGLPDEDIWYMHRIGRVGRAKNTGEAFVIYKNGIDNALNRLTNKSIQFQYYQLKNDVLIEKPLKLNIKHKRMFDQETNDKIKFIISTQSHRVRPGYKKKIKNQINKIKQKKRHEFIEKRIKQTLLAKNIRDTKREFKKRNKGNQF